MQNELDAEAVVVRDLETATDRILRATLEALKASRVETLQLAEVARQARVSLATIYKGFGSRDGLLLAAVERWMEFHAYRPLAALDPCQPPQAGDDLAVALSQYFRRLFEPWEREPRMLEVFTQVRHGPGGVRLAMHGVSAMAPALRALLAGIDPDLRQDLLLIVTNVHYGLVSRFTAGEIAVGDIAPALERAIRCVLRAR